MAHFQTQLPYETVKRLLDKSFINVNKDVCILDYSNHVIVLSNSQHVDDNLKKNTSFEKIQFSSEEKFLRITRGQQPKIIAGNCNLY